MKPQKNGQSELEDVHVAEDAPPTVQEATLFCGVVGDLLGTNVGSKMRKFWELTPC